MFHQQTTTYPAVVHHNDKQETSHQGFQCQQKSNKVMTAKDSHRLTHSTRQARKKHQADQGKQEFHISQIDISNREIRV
jgi:hypothetical protein